MCSRFLKLNTLILVRVIKEMMTMQHAKENQSEQIRWDVKANAPIMTYPEEVLTRIQNTLTLFHFHSPHVNLLRISRQWLCYYEETLHTIGLFGATCQCRLL